MGIDNPGATSTPTTLPSIKGRRGIRDRNSIQSPIEHSREFWNEYDVRTQSNELSSSRSPSRSPCTSPLRQRKQQNPKQAVSGSESDDSNSDREEPPHRQFVNFINSEKIKEYHSLNNGGFQQPEEAKQNKIHMMKSLGILGAALVVFLWAVYSTIEFNVSEAHESCQDITHAFKLIENKFNNQEEDFWRNIKVSIKEIPVLNQPRTIIFLYEDKTQATLDIILNQVANIASCYLTESILDPVTIHGPSLNTNNIINDHGAIISKYREALETKKVMIVRNLEQIPGKSAQAFHSFCDDYNPIVHKALILFTMKVDKIPQEYPMKFLEKLLLNLWKDIGKDDKFYPLFTRISGTILRVYPEL